MWCAVTTHGFFRSDVRVDAVCKNSQHEWNYSSTYMCRSWEENGGNMVVFSITKANGGCAWGGTVKTNFACDEAEIVVRRSSTTTTSTASTYDLLSYKLIKTGWHTFTAVLDFASTCFWVYPPTFKLHDTNFFQFHRYKVQSFPPIPCLACFIVHPRSVPCIPLLSPFPCHASHSFHRGP